MPDDGLVYELSTPQVLDGSSKYIDTQLRLCERDIDYTIFMNFKMNVVSSIQAARPILGGIFYKCTFQNFNCSLGHLRNFIAYDCEINDMHLGALQEQLYLYNCNINNISFSNYTLYNDIKIYDSQVNNFSYSRLAWSDASVYKVNVDIELKKFYI